VTLGNTACAEVEAFLIAVDADDDVQNIYAGLAPVRSEKCREQSRQR
jgi:hypothetical protein